MIAAFIPIKENSERVPGKNLRPLGAKRLYEYIIDAALDADCFDDIYVDTNSGLVRDYAENAGARTIERDPRLAESDANGNDLLCHHFDLFPHYDHYFQLFATAPFLTVNTIRACAMLLHNRQLHDSIFTAIQRPGWYWCKGLPVNYSPGLLPRSQDAVQVVQETTGLYGIKRPALARYRCRIGATPYFHMVSEREALDIDSEEDFKLAEYYLAAE